MTRRAKLQPFFWIISTILVASVAPDVSAQDRLLPAEGRWEGMAELPQGPLGMTITLENDGSNWSGIFEVPTEGVTVPVPEVAVRGDSVILQLAPGRTLAGQIIGDSIAGVFTMQGMELSAAFGREGSAVAIRLTDHLTALADAARAAPLVQVGGIGASPGIEPTALQRLVDAAGAAHSHSLVVYHDTTLVGAWHAGGQRRMIESMSATKSILNLIVGRMVTTGIIPSLDEPVHSYFDEWATGPKSAVTIRHLLDHTSGLATPMPTTPIYESPDFVQYALSSDLVNEPGTAFEYNNNATNLLAGLLERAAGEPLKQFLERDLFAQLGITEFDWSVDEAGNSHGMAGLQIHAEDLAKLGRLVLDRGLWNGERLIDEDWFEVSLRPGSELNPTVGLLWWLIRDDHDEIVGYRADGYLGQYLVIYPEERLVGVRMVEGSPAYDAETDGFREFQSRLRELVPR